MQAHVAIRIEEVGDPLRLMAADVVADDMDFAAFRLVGDDLDQEGHELFAGVACGRLAQHLAGGRVERREQAERAVALVLEAVPATAVASGPCGRAPGLRSSRSHRTQLRAQVGSGTALSRRPPWPRSPDRWRPCADPAAAA